MHLRIIIKFSPFFPSIYPYILHKLCFLVQVLLNTYKEKQRPNPVFPKQNALERLKELIYTHIDFFFFLTK